MLLEPHVTAQRSKLGCVHSHYSSITVYGRGSDMSAVTTQTLLPHLSVLPFTFAFEHFTGLCATVAPERICSKRASLPVLSSNIKVPSPVVFNFLRNPSPTHRANNRQRCSNIEQTSSSTTSPIPYSYLLLSSWSPSRFSSLLRSPASLLPMTFLTTVCILQHMCVAQADVLCSRLCCSCHRDCHRNRVRHA